MAARLILSSFLIFSRAAFSRVFSWVSHKTPIFEAITAFAFRNEVFLIGLVYAVVISPYPELKAPDKRA